MSPGRDLGPLHSASVTGSACRRRTSDRCPRAVPAAAPSSAHDLTLAARVGRLEHGLAVEADVASASSTRPYGSLATTKASSAEADVERLTAARRASRRRSGSLAALQPRWPPIPRTRRPSTGRPRRSLHGPRGGAETRVGMTLASVVISAGRRRRLERLQVGVVVDVAVEPRRRGGPPHARRPVVTSHSWLSGCALASEMIPTLAQPGVARAPRPARSPAAARGATDSSSRIARAGVPCCRRARRSPPRSCRRTRDVRRRHATDPR